MAKQVYPIATDEIEEKKHMVRLSIEANRALTKESLDEITFVIARLAIGEIESSVGT